MPAGDDSVEIPIQTVLGSFIPPLVLNAVIPSDNKFAAGVIFFDEADGKGSVIGHLANGSVVVFFPLRFVENQPVAAGASFSDCFPDRFGRTPHPPIVGAAVVWILVLSQTVDVIALHHRGGGVGFAVGAVNIKMAETKLAADVGAVTGDCYPLFG